ncbi:MAG: hypothetical protein OQL16_01735 [Gammaproteobacteria bacterium]|nr:hypothetical protein [Gammaproteobacteria bacterium]
MKGISLADFVEKTRNEVVEAATRKPEEHIFNLKQVELTVKFQLEGSVETGFNLFAIAKGKAGAKAGETHEVKLILEPLEKGADSNKGIRTLNEAPFQKLGVKVDPSTGYMIIVDAPSGQVVRPTSALPGGITLETFGTLDFSKSFKIDDD